MIVFYDYYHRLTVSLAYRIPTLILTSTNLACYQMCKLALFAYS